MRARFPCKSYNRVIIVLLSVWLTYYGCQAGSLEVNKTRFQCVESERDALLHFKMGIRVDHCGLLDSWGRTQDCCQWHGIRCDNQSDHVIGLKLCGSPGSDNYDAYSDYDDNEDGGSYNPCFEGTLSDSLLNLKHLKYLDLSYNNFSGQFPKFIGSFASLERLNLSNVGLGGVIPQEIGNLSRLTSIDLHVESSFMSVDDLGWLSRMRLLREVDLSGIFIDEIKNNWLSIVNNLPFLRRLLLDGCGLSGGSSSSLSYVNSSTTLSVLSLSKNNLNDTSVFEWLLNLSGLETNLIYLDLSYNAEEFESNMQLPAVTMKLPNNLCSLKTLAVSDNNVNYKFNDIIQSFSTCRHKALVSLLLDGNQGRGSFPDNIGNFSNLRELDVEGSHLIGTIPQSIGKLTMLDTLNLDSNSLDGIITITHLSNLSKLTYLDFSFNKDVVINISVDWIPPFQLHNLYLQTCKIGPSFPRWITTQTKLWELDISNSSISDTIPTSFWNSSLLSRIQSFDMSHNMIYGTIPNVPIIFKNHPEIAMGYNLLEGVIPSFLRNNVSVLHINNNKFSKGLSPFLCPHAQMPLSILDLSNNLFSEKFPDCWSYFNHLFSLNLDNNGLWGNLPISMGALVNLEGLTLSNNNLSGELPMWLVNCKSLLILDLANNSLIGHIPPSFGHSLGDLAILNLQNNEFTGVIPTSLCDLSNLQIMDLSDNHISGSIPKCLSKLVSMVNDTDDERFSSYLKEFYTATDATRVTWKRNEQTFGGLDSLGLLIGIDISNNKLQGHIPEDISSLVRLKFLNLSRNNLSGAIMSRIGQLTSLESLDLSHNHLTGEIPPSLAQISSLSSFDISDNNLTGKIPVSTQLQSFDASNYMGNPSLCGAPLPTCVEDEPPAIAPNGYHESHKVDEFMLGVYISVILGFIFGFWGVCGTLIVKRSWRHAYFRFYEDMRDKVFVIWVVNIAGAWRRS